MTGASSSMNFDPPKFLSVDFHLKFLPSLLWRLMRAKTRKDVSPFQNHVPMEFTIVTVLAVAAATWGFVAALEEGSITGWIVGIPGMVVLLALLINSVSSARDLRPSYESFRVEIFLFLVLLGTTIGLMVGRIGFSQSGWKIVLDGCGGLLIGYVAGVFGGLWIQRLGWIAFLFRVLAMPAIPGMIILDIIMLL
jgi:hypothetical protein